MYISYYPRVTDMEGVKKIAKSILYLPVEPVEGFDPSLIVHHPYTNSSIWMNPNDSEIGILNLLDEKDLRTFQGIIYENVIKTSKSPMSLLIFITKPYRSFFLRQIYGYLNKEDAIKCLRSVWMSCDYVNHDVNVEQDVYLVYWKSISEKERMTVDEIKKYEELKNKESLTLYRGARSNSNETWKALSWTLSRETAEFFATRFLHQNEKGYICTLTLEGEEISRYLLAYLDECNEDEVLLDSNFITDQLLESNKVAYEEVIKTSSGKINSETIKKFLNTK